MPILQCFNDVSYKYLLERHSHASLLISMGENPLLIKERLGHEKNPDNARHIRTFISKHES